MTNTKKFSEFVSAVLSDSNNELVGVGGGLNIKSPKVVVWTTATRPTPPFDGLLGFNTDLEQYEFWSGSLLAWVQLASSVNLSSTFILETPDLTLPNSFALSTLATGILKNTTGTGVPSISLPLTSIDSLVTVPNQIIYTTAPNTYATTTLSAFSRGLLDNIDAATWRTDLGVAGLPVNVSEGGTGGTSFTAFAVITAGTTATNPFQNVVGVGIAGQALTSNGPGMLPTWQSAASSGTVNPGLANQVAYYAANGTVVSGLATLANGVLVTDVGGVPSISNTLPLTVQTNITSLGTITTGIWNGTIIDVPHGGTGASSFTAFSVICGGTSSTNPFQNVVGLGSIGQVLTSNGAGALPSWVNAPGTGTINSGLINQVAYYAAPGTTISGLTTANSGLLVTSATGVPSILAGPGTTGNILQSNAAAAPSFSTATYPSITTVNQILYSSATNVITGITTANSSVLITSAGGVPSLSTTLPAGLTIPGYALSGANSDITSLLGLTGVIKAPTAIQDANSNNYLHFTSTASAVNYIEITNNSTGQPPAIASAGTDGAIALLFSSKNAYFDFRDSTSTVAATLRFQNAAHSQYTALKVADAAASTVTFTLPSADGSANFIMKTNGSAVLSLTNGSQIAGTATNDNASAGNIGEYVESVIAAASAVTLTNNTNVDVTSISLTAGDWDVWGNVSLTNTGTTQQVILAWVSSTSATLVDASLYNGIALTTAGGVVSTGSGATAPQRRFSLSGTTTVYLTARSTATSGNAQGCGRICARRVR